MNSDFMQKCVQQTIDQLLDQIIIEQSQESAGLLSQGNFASKNMKEFSMSYNALFVIMNFCKAFHFENIHVFVGLLLKRALKNTSKFFGHFSQYYNKVSL